jgi:hypothetical protein
MGSTIISSDAYYWGNSSIIVIEDVAQTIFGPILGTVTDSSGGIIPGATFTLANNGTSEQSQVPGNGVSFGRGNSSCLIPIYLPHGDIQGFQKRLHGCGTTGRDTAGACV